MPDVMRQLQKIEQCYCLQAAMIIDVWIEVGQCLPPLREKKGKGKKRKRILIFPQLSCSLALVVITCALDIRFPKASTLLPFKTTSTTWSREVIVLRYLEKTSIGIESSCLQCAIYSARTTSSSVLCSLLDTCGLDSFF